MISEAIVKMQLFYEKGWTMTPPLGGWTAQPWNEGLEFSGGTADPWNIGDSYFGGWAGFVPSKSLEIVKISIGG